MSKGYTIPFFINTVRDTTLAQWSHATTASRVNYGTVISPLKGASSVKVKVLSKLLGGNLSAIVAGKGKFGALGLTPRGRLLKALSIRSNGFVF